MNTNLNTFIDSSEERRVVFNPADIIVTGAPRGQQSSWISKWIQNATQMTGEDPTLFSHAGIIGKGGTFEEATIIEMTWPKMREVSLIKHYGSASMRVWRLFDFPEIQAKAMVQAARAWKRHPWKKWYGLEKLPMFLLDSLISKLFSRIVGHPTEFRLFSTFNLTRRLVCSQVVSRLYQIYADVPFSMSSVTADKLASMFSKKLVGQLHARTHLRIATDGPGVTPDDIDDYCISHPSLFFDVYSS